MASAALTGGQWFHAVSRFFSRKKPNQQKETEGHFDCDGIHGSKITVA